MQPQIGLTSSLPPFLAKLSHLAGTCDSSIAYWSDDGTFFIIAKAREFKKVLTSLFSASKAEQTFVRQLHYYGFSKFDTSLQNGGKGWAFSHPDFLRDDPMRLSSIIRRVNGSSSKMSKSSSSAKRMKVSSFMKKSLNRLDRLEETMDVLESKAEEISQRVAQIAEQVNLAHQSLFPSQIARRMSDTPAVQTVATNPLPEREDSLFSPSNFWMGTGTQSISPRLMPPISRTSSEHLDAFFHSNSAHATAVN